MDDLTFVLTSIAFFLVALGYALACERGFPRRKGGV